MIAALLLIFALQDPPQDTPSSGTTDAPAQVQTETSIEAPVEALVETQTETSEPTLADALTCQTVAATLGAAFGERAATEEGTVNDAQIADYLSHLAERARQDARLRARSGMTESDLDVAMAEATTRREAAAQDGEDAQLELERCAGLYPAD